MAANETIARPPSLLDALIPLLFMIGMLALSVVLFGVDASLGTLQVALFLSAAVAATVAHKNGHSWTVLGEEVVKGVSLAIAAIMILLMVGALIGVWNMSGTIATIVYFGIKYIDPAWFYLAVALITGLTGLVTGSSWTTAATLGVAFMGMSVVLGLSPAITAGAVISGSYFGDKMTPLSETTILTPQIVGSDVTTHIRSMAYATVPAYLISLALFWYLGRGAGTTIAPVDTEAALQAISSVYIVGPWTLLPIVVLLVLGLRKFPAFLSILVGALAGGLVAIFLQPSLVEAFVNNPVLPTPLVMIKGVWMAMATGYISNTGMPAIDRLFTGGGMSSMLLTVWLILGAMSFGAVMDSAGFNQRLISPVIGRVRSAGGAILTVMATAIGLNIVAGDQYVAIVIPARMFLVEFYRRGLHPETLATAIENSATVTSPLVPWNSCGAYMSATLGVSTFVYFPYCFFNILNAAIGAIFAVTGINVRRLAADAPPPIAFVPAPLIDQNK